MSGVATTASKSVQPALNLLDELLAPDDVGAGFLGFLLLLSAGNREHALGLAQAVRQHHRAAHHLVGVLGIDAQPQRQLDGLVELRELDFLRERNRFFERIAAIGSNLGSGGRVFLAVLAHA